jgi:hypothetical protein
MKLSAKDKRDRLFRKSKPHIRTFVAEDLWVLWAAYDLDSFKGLKKGLTKDEFFKLVEMIASRHSSCIVVEDECKWFKSGRGPICFVTIANNGWRIEPHVDFFRWATPRVMLRAYVAFFQMVRYSKEVGVCVVRSLANTVPLFERMRTYGLLFPVGRIPDGDARGDEYLYQVRGKKHGRTDGVRLTDGERGRLQRPGDGKGSASDSPERQSDVSGQAVFREQGRQDSDGSDASGSGADSGWRGPAHGREAHQRVAAAGSA